MYDTEGRRCPVHPTVIRTCPICAEPNPDGYLPENFVEDSQNFTSNWGLSELTRNFPSAYKDPFGQPSYVFIPPTVAVAEHFTEQYLVGIGNNELVNVSCWGLSGYLLFVSVVLKDNVSVIGVIFDCQAGIVYGSSGMPSYNARVTERAYAGLGLTWSRCSVPINVGSGAAVPRIRLQLYEIGTGLVFAWNTTSGLGLYGPQVTRGPELREYRKTVAPQPTFSHLPDNAVIDQINYQAETATHYNTIQPASQPHDSMRHLAAKLRLDEHWDDPRDRVPPPPLLLPVLGL